MDTAASELRGDHLSIFHDPVGGHTVVAWRLRFSRAAVATQLDDLLACGYEPLFQTWWVWAHDRDLIVMATDDPNLDRALGNFLDWQAPPAGDPAGGPRSPARVLKCGLRPSIQ